jgi:hypothetical protein
MSSDGRKLVFLLVALVLVFSAGIWVGHHLLDDRMVPVCPVVREPLPDWVLEHNLREYAGIDVDALQAAAAAVEAPQACPKSVNCVGICGARPNTIWDYGNIGMAQPGLEPCGCDCGDGRERMIARPAHFDTYRGELPPSLSCVGEKVGDSGHVVFACPESVWEEREVEK